MKSCVGFGFYWKTDPSHALFPHLVSQCSSHQPSWGVLMTGASRASSLPPNSISVLETVKEILQYELTGRLELT